MQKRRSLNWDLLLRGGFIPFLLVCRLVLPPLFAHVISGQALAQTLPALICADIGRGKLFPDLAGDAACAIELKSRAENEKFLYMEGTVRTGETQQELTLILRKLPADRYWYDRSCCYPGAGWEQVELSEALWTDILTIENDAIFVRVKPKVLLILTAVMMEGWMLCGPLLPRLRRRGTETEQKQDSP